ncbi:hypothetical protein NJO91_26260 [Streptomyces microflavus]|uniref:hypothetical protein n=1 Tax=Streptomyces griseus group TaxID=629295 RepID=UPI0029BA4300|nr:hypothetical protein [Streptomyces microflavus]MDX2406611.1 hypothetical protein [Streptomyces microflavus]
MKTAAPDEVGESKAIDAEDKVNDEISLRAVVLALVGVLGTYAAFRDADLGAALLVGASLVTVLVLIMRR